MSTDVYTEEEISFLKSNYQNMTIEEMAKFIFGLGPYYSCALCPACKICDPNNQCIENI